MSASQYRPNDVDIDLRQLFLSLVRNWKRILFWSLVVAGIAFAAAWMATPKYRSEARVEIGPRESVFTRPDLANRDDSTAFGEEGVATQVENITSSRLLLKVANQLAPEDRAEFGEVANPSIFGRLLVLAGLSADQSDLPQDERLLKGIRERLSVYRVDKSRVIAIEFSSENPRVAAAIPNAIARAYLEENSSAKLESNTDATKWLQTEIADLTGRVRAAEEKVARFRSDSDLLVGNNGESVLANQQLSEVSSELSRVRAARAAAEANAASVQAAMRTGTSIEVLPKIVESPLIQRLREREVQLKTDIADLSTTLLGSHPRIRSLRSQLSDLEGQIRAEAQNILRSLSSEADAARAREAQLVADLNRQKAESSRAGEDQVELRALEREAAAQRDLLESYLTRYREASSRDANRYLPADARIIATALVPPEPYFPKVVPIVAAAFTGSLLLFTLGTLLQSLFSGAGLRYQETSPFAPGTTYAEPAVATAERLVPANHDEAAVAIEGNAGEIDVPAAVERLINEGIGRAIFISPEGDDGAAASVMTAREAADKGLHVLLVDLTASGAPSRTMLEHNDDLGITDLLVGQAQFADIIHSDHFSECHVLPNGTADPAEAMRAAARLPIVLSSLATVYDLIVIECGAANSTAIRRLVSENTALLVSAIDSGDEVVAIAANELRSAGYEDVLLVSPKGGISPPPARGRYAA